MTFHTRTSWRRAVCTLSAIVVAVGVLLATASTDSVAPGDVASVASARYAAAHRPKVRASRAIAHSLVAKINAERRNRGLRELRPNKLLAKYAQHWGRHLITSQQFLHQDLGRIIVASHYRLAEVGENLFSGSGRGAIDSGTAHVALMHSSSHRANILLPQAQMVGIAALCVGRKLMVVEEFGITSGAPLPRPGQGVRSIQPLISKSTAGPSC
jgi:uncharacterized protein YkwD